MAEPQERRRRSDTVEDKVDALIGMFTLHMTKEEVDINSIKVQLEQYFHDLDAHTHIFHHSKVAENIKDANESHDFWTKVKSSVTEKIIIFALGGVATYLCALLWLDFGNRLQAVVPKETPVVTIQMPPKATPNVTNHP